MPRASQVARQSRRFASEVRRLGLRIRALRQEREWTLERAAEAMNLDLKHLQKIEAGQINITLVSLVRIAEGLEVPVNELFVEPQGRKRHG